MMFLPVAHQTPSCLTTLLYRRTYICLFFGTLSYKAFLVPNPHVYDDHHKMARLSFFLRFVLFFFLFFGLIIM